ncbi:hypothetical protein BWGOE4_45060 [Bacillus mycoides]|uniref:hypothetical protein n=1 Tax=Bacillus mycoides TaxID=1405 RepID=UPI000873414E|nr:hypothetical protein [Bacillus mycoides]OFD54017.1 hypothetical protein BWGOE4_45060 [Bacillus mycoides]OFD60491.1 hypothetical protein BWGOE7_45230 [Bacillus mycoides]OFD90731.1 hypothetical protein BWGOE12_45300 [Bacillus mycoides]
MTSTNTITHTDELKNDITSECSKSNALLLGKAIFDKLAEVTGFDAGISRSLVETRVYGGRSFHVAQETMPQRIVMALNIEEDSVHIAMGKTTEDTKFYAMTFEEFSSLLGLLSHNIPKNQARELFDMAVRIETKQRNYI